MARRLTLARMLNSHKGRAALAALSEQEADALKHDWSFMARPKQIEPPGDWSTWLYLGGRGVGKSKNGAEWIRGHVKAGARYLGCVGATAADVRDVMIEGESGLLSVCWEHDQMLDGTYLGKPDYEPSKGRVTWRNGAKCTLRSADEPDRVRGPQYEYLWADELAAWRRPEAWDNAMLGLRLGAHPRAFVSTTPKPTDLIKKLLDNPNCIVSKEATYENVHLADSFFAEIVSQYENTYLGRQELHAEVLEDAPGALWTRNIIDETRVRRPPDPDDLDLVVVGVDPPASAAGAECGIIAAARDKRGHGYILDDTSRRGLPHVWARAAVRLRNRIDADYLVAEANQGGDMVAHTLRGEDPNVPVRLVHAARGKRTRAEPIALLFERGKIHLVNYLPELEAQMIGWEPGEDSPDRLDAMVWALTELMLGPQPIREVKVVGL